jgi:hypothetical protein
VSGRYVFFFWPNMNSMQLMASFLPASDAAKGTCRKEGRAGGGEARWAAPRQMSVPGPADARGRRAGLLHILPRPLMRPNSCIRGGRGRGRGGVAGGAPTNNAALPCRRRASYGGDCLALVPAPSCRPTPTSEQGGSGGGRLGRRRPDERRRLTLQTQRTAPSQGGIYLRPLPAHLRSLGDG